MPRLSLLFEMMSYSVTRLPGMGHSHEKESDFVSQSNRQIPTQVVFCFQGIRILTRYLGHLPAPMHPLICNLLAVSTHRSDLFLGSEGFSVLLEI